MHMAGSEDYRSGIVGCRNLYMLREICHAKAVTRLLTNTPAKEQRNETCAGKMRKNSQSEYWEEHVFILTMPQL
jgi:hypothetical protein